MKTNYEQWLEGELSLERQWRRDLEKEVSMWKERYESERRDHLATIKHADEMLREYESEQI